MSDEENKIPMEEETKNEETGSENESEDRKNDEEETQVSPDLKDDSSAKEEPVVDIDELEESHEELQKEIANVLDEDEDETEEELEEEGENAEDKEGENAEKGEEEPAAEGEGTEAKGKGKRSRKAKGKDKRREPQKFDPNSSPKLKKLISESEKITDVNTLKDLRDRHNGETRELINRIKKIQNELGNIRGQAKEYKRKRDELNAQVQVIKKQKEGILGALNNSQNELKRVKNEAKSTQSNGKQRGVASQIQRLRKEIEQLEKKIETEDLEMKEENQIVDEIEERENELQTILKENSKPSQFSEQIDTIRKNKEDLKKFNEQLKALAEESQNYHLLFLDVAKEMTELRNEKIQLQRDLNENRYIADVYHQRLVDSTQKMFDQKKIGRKMAFQNQKKMKKEIQEITLKEAVDKQKKGQKLNIFEARAILEEQANKTGKE